MKLYQRLAGLVDAYLRCRELSKLEWMQRHLVDIDALVKEHMPSGSGFDNGTKIDLTVSTGEMLRFNVGFHHMNEHGSYDGWTDHKVTVRASLTSFFDIKVTGRDRNEIKGYIAEAFRDALLVEVYKS